VKAASTTCFDEIPENPEHASLGENGENDQEQIAIYVAHGSCFFLSSGVGTQDRKARRSRKASELQKNAAGVATE
jgi:hypothetical protein